MKFTSRILLLLAVLVIPFVSPRAELPVLLPGTYKLALKYCWLDLDEFDLSAYPAPFAIKQ